MNAEKSLKLARRFIELPLEKRRLFLEGLRAEKIDFSLFPIPAGVLVEDRQALSYAQQRMWFLWQLDPQSGAYNLPGAVRLTGPLHELALEQAFASLVARHETLRTVFRPMADQRLEQVPLQQPLRVEHLDLTELSVDQREARVRQEAERQSLEPFDLEQGPLLRVRLLKLDHAEHVLLLTLHHIVSDGWSMNLLIDEFSRFYSAHVTGAEALLAPLPIQYSDYGLWQRRWLEAGEQERQLDYWREQLGDEHPVLELPTDRPRPALPSHRGTRHEFAMDDGLAQQLRNLARQQNVTLFMLLLGAFTLLLQRYSGQTDIRVGVPIANRNRSELEGLIGFFVNTQVLRTRIDPQATVAELLLAIRDTALGAQAHQDLPFEQLVEALRLERSMSHTPLFQVMYNHQPQVADVTTLQLESGLELGLIHWQSRTTQFDLTLDTYEKNGKLHAALTYATDLFDPATAERMAQHWQNLLHAMVADASQRIGDLALLDTYEQRQLINDWNATEVDYPLERPVHHLIEAQVARTPEAPALVFGREQLTYRQLNERANHLANRLIELGVGPGVLVGIAVERSLEMVIGLLAVLKAGGAYVPLDPEYPQERLAYMIEDSGIGLLLTQGHLLEQLPIPESLALLALDQLDPGAGVVSNPQVAVHPESLAYVIYTSGSTGKPKGAGNRHLALTNRLCWMQQAYSLDARDTVLQKTPFSFDVSVWEFFWPLMTGARLAVAGPGDHRDPAKMVELIQGYQVSTLHFVPSMLQVFLLDPQVASCTSLRRIVCSGEALQVDTQQQVFAKLPGAGLFNLYGPTEAAIDVTHWTCREEGRDGVPIGQPIANLTTYILDGALEPVPVGVVGELYLGGAGLARGYHRRAGLTAERFLTSPFGDGARLYRTGDLACYRADGVIEYRGRIDHQVKIRGLRIELGEIEARLMEQDVVREAVVLAVAGPGGQQLVGYVVPACTTEQSELRAQIQAQLKQNLPDYMVPTQIIFLQQLPLSPNGKLERKALPKPDALQQQNIYQAPRTELEQQIAAIWQDVLKLEQVGLTDDFFELGGHSLLATQVVSRVRQSLGLEVALRTLFEHSRLAEFAASLGPVTQGQEPPFVRVDREQPLALSYAQERQWFLWQLDPESAAYHLPTALRLHGDLDVQTLQRSLDTLIERHESLRTTFVETSERTLQRIAGQMALPIDLEVLPPVEDRAAQIKARVEVETARLFDLQQGPLLRVKLLRLAPDDHVLILTQHHIVSDGWSMQVMVDELVALYAGHSQGLKVELPELPIQYADYGVWQRQWMDAGERERQLAYWVGQLGGEQTVLELPADHGRPAEQSFRGAKVDLALGAELSKALRHLAQQQGVTPFMLLLASFQALLHRYSGQTDIRVGVPIANRNRVETERLIGFFVNTLVLKAELDGQVPFSELLQHVRQTALDAQSHQDLPFEQLVEALQPERSLSQSPLFQVMYNHQGEGQQAQAARQLQHLRLEALEWDNPTSQFDLSLDTQEHGEEFSAILTYATDLFEASTIERLARHWQNLLQAIVADPEQRIGDLPLLDAAEQQRMISDWGRATLDYPSQARVHQLFEARVEAQPEAVALIFEDAQLSYRQLNSRANRLARHLQERGVGPDVLVGIAVERGLDMIIGLLAVLKAGGAYVPLDPEYPQDRLLCMIEDSGTRLLLTQSHLQSRLSIPVGVASLCLDRDADWAGLDDGNLVNRALADNLAYVMFTSGSTGRPKGVGISQSALTRHAYVSLGFFNLNGSDRILQFSTFNFDGFVEQLYPALICGASVVLRGTEIWDSERFYCELISKRISVLDLTTAYWNLLAKDFAAIGPRDYGVLKQVHAGGEAMPPEGLAAWKQAGLEQVVLLNTYGPTEATVTVTALDCTDYVSGARPTPLTMPIGNVLPGRSIYVLDDTGSPAPIGVVGELVIGGELLARGYFNRPDLSAERFMPDPFAEQPGGRLYRTGDLARFNADGIIEYVGRIDHQVKIRGFRIELGEIEARLLEQDGIREAIVLAQASANGLQLVGYVVPEDVRQVGTEPEVQASLREAIKGRLREHLPDYMVPAYLLFLEKLPLSPNGKLDRKALPKADASQMQQLYVAPRSELEQQVAAIWQEVLKLEQVGLTDSFFELGGHSLLATQVVSRVRHALNREVPLRSLFEHSSLQDFVASLGDRPARHEPPFVRVERDRPLALSYAQERQWFLWKLEPESAAYHIPAALRLHGPLDVPALERSFNTLVARHESLRTRFVDDGERTLQVIDHGAPLNLQWDVLPAGGDQAGQVRAYVEAETSRLFDLREGALLRVKLLRLAPDDHVLVMTQHHIVSDGWSMDLMVDELVALYAAYSQGLTVELPELPIQYADYGIWQRQWMDAGERERQLGYWVGQLGGEQPVLELPTDFPRPAEQSYRGAHLDVPLPPQLSGALRSLAQREGVTPFMLLLASFQILLHRYSGQADIRVGVPIANRNRVETEGLIGFFVNTQVLKAELDAQQPFRAVLQQVRQAALGAQAHQDLPFEQLVEELHPERSLSHNPLFQVMFNHQAQAQQAQTGRQLPHLRLEALEWDNPTSQFDLSLDTQEYGEEFSAILTYATDLFEASTIERLARHWQNLLQAIVADPEQRIGDLPLLDAAEQQRMITDWGRATLDYPSQARVHQLFEARVEAQPEAVALIFEDAQLSYRQLNSRANRLARHLQERGVGPDVLVGIAVERGLDMIIGLLAVLKAGGAYVPLDPEYPQDRLLCMIEDSGTRLLLTQSHLQSRLSIPVGVASLCLDQDADWAGLDDGNLVNRALADNLAYVMFTSGSTGRPKGVGISQSALTRHAYVSLGFFNLNGSDRILQFSTFNFDGFVEQLYPALICGASVVLRGTEIWDSERFYRELISKRISVLDLTTAYWNLLAKDFAAIGPRDYGVLKQVHAGGEAMPPEGLAAWKQAGLEQVVLLNTYGPTEATVTVTALDCTDYVSGARPTPLTMPIGNVLPGRSIYVLDDTGSPAPIGVVGELVIGGELLARGYFNRPDLSAERFMPDPFAEQPGGRLYRTGDLARFNADGIIEYVGRIDHQVKIRGFRIELGEIEARLLEQEGIREAIVLAQASANGLQLVGYVVPEDVRQVGTEPEVQASLREAIKGRLREHLPDYMVPAYLLFLEKLPLSPNGKLDRKALPKADASQMQQLYVAPRSELEQQVAAIWQEVLKLEQVGLTDSFFELGGHSLLATQVIVRVREQLGVEVPLKDLFIASNLQAFAEGIAALKSDSQPLQDELAKSLAALKRLSGEELEKLIS
ncbi:amino acid adenylation domain-containing protein [Pseudomonas sp. QD4]|uniref:amino acid adenylation domain-containing protein n=1 Tax=Pseudomonas sp. QD4 TaxID=3368618 RepID=UPI003BA22962